MRSRLAVRCLALFFVAFPITSQAQWQLDGAPASTANGDQWIHEAVADGAGGVFIAWMDGRNGSWGNHLLYVQRLDAYGKALWTLNGVGLTTAPEQFYPKLLADGAGGVFVCWSDTRGGGDIYMQRVSGSGVPLWTANGVAICGATGFQDLPALISDGAGGAIIAWSDWRNGVHADIYAQRVNASGSAQWTANGVPLSTAADGQFDPELVRDGAGGAIVTWYDLRNGNYDIYAQRFNASGATQWTLNGVAICNLVEQQSNPVIISDGGTGAIITWLDYRIPSNVDVYGQRVNAAGVAQWTANGVVVGATPDDEGTHRTIPDGAGGAIVVWDNYAADKYISAQRVNAAGVRQWAAGGVPVCTAPSFQYLNSVEADGAGGAIAVWHDFRSGVGYDVYAQRINASGVPQWTTDGISICAATNDQVYPVVVSGGANSAIVAWYDLRTGNADIYAQRVEFDEQYWGHPEPTMVSVADIPGDQGGRVKVNWQHSGWDARDFNTIVHYSIWRATEFQPVGAQVVSGAEKIGADFSGNAYRRDIDAAGNEYYWEWVGNQSAIFSPRYSFSAETRSDSTSQGVSSHYFQVVAHTWNNFVFWASNVMSGHSVDNLAPAAPFLLTAQRAGNDVNLTWNRAVAPDLRDYSVYRATTTGVTPVPLNFLSTSDDTVLVDANAPVTALYYIVTAFDVHENQSAPSNEASVGALTGIEETPAIATLTVMQNYPNPFTGTTELEIGLPAASDLTIEVYDVAGRRVCTQSLTQQAAGWRRISFDGRNDGGQLLTSGVYFYKVTANGTTVTRKMVIAR